MQVAFEADLEPHPAYGNAVVEVIGTVGFVDGLEGEAQERYVFWSAIAVKLEQPNQTRIAWRAAFGEIDFEELARLALALLDAHPISEAHAQIDIQEDDGQPSQDVRIEVNPGG